MVVATRFHKQRNETKTNNYDNIFPRSLTLVTSTIMYAPDVIPGKGLQHILNWYQDENCSIEQKYRSISINEDYGLFVTVISDELLL